ncbi:hypothetical protein EMPS_07056 [Entomortierella parvispora]|uniref:Uncharacterized protein n=1 Tax=Entomortierella parvispora TaxID=205924 RepID=A0A9P3HDV7_9FUNG|nr:hypothetical protein EMPS_07056 [Entomortierella parvispora]
MHTTYPFSQQPANDHRASFDGHHPNYHCAPGPLPTEGPHVRKGSRSSPLPQPVPGLIPKPAPYSMQTPPSSTRHWPTEAEIPDSFWARFRQELNSDRAQLQQELMLRQDRHRQQMEAHMNQLPLLINTHNDQVLQAMDAHVQRLRKDIEASTEDLTRKINAVEVMPDWLENWLTVWYDYQTDFVKGQKRFKARHHELGLPATATTTATVSTPDNADEQSKVENDHSEHKSGHDDDSDGNEDNQGGKKKDHQPSRILVRPPEKPNTPQRRQPGPKSAVARALQKRIAIKESTAVGGATDVSSAQVSTSKSHASGSKDALAPVDLKLTKKRGAEARKDEPADGKNLKRNREGPAGSQVSDRPALPEIHITDCNDDDDDRSVQEIDFGDVDEEEDQASEGVKEPQDVPEPKEGRESGDQELEEDNAETINSPKYSRKRPRLPSDSSSSPAPSASASSPSTSSSSSSSSSSKAPSSNSSSSGYSSSSSPRSHGDEEGSSRKKLRLDNSQQALFKYIKKNGKINGSGDRDVDVYLHTRVDAKEFYALLRTNPKAVDLLDLQLKWDFNRADMEELALALERSYISELVIYRPTIGNVNDGDFAMRLMQNKRLTHLMLRHFSDFLLQPELHLPKDLSHLKDLEITFQLDSFSHPHIGRVQELFRRLTRLERVILRTPPELCRAQLAILKRILALETAGATLCLPPSSSAPPPARTPPQKLMVLFRCCKNIALRVEVLRATAEFRSIELVHRALTKAELPWPTLLATPSCRSIPIIDLQNTTDDSWLKGLLEVAENRKKRKNDAPLKELLLDCTHIQSTHRVKDLVSILTEFRNTLTAVGLSDFKPKSYWADEPTDPRAPSPPLRPSSLSHRQKSAPAAKGTGTTRRVLVSGWKAVFEALNWGWLEWLDLSFTNLGPQEIDLIVVYLRQIANQGRRAHRLVIVTNSLSTNKDFQRLAQIIQDNHWGAHVTIRNKTKA